MSLVENGFGINAGFLFVMAFYASSGSVARDFMWAMTNITRGRTFLFAVVRVV